MEALVARRTWNFPALNPSTREALAVFPPWWIPPTSREELSRRWASSKRSGSSHSPMITTGFRRKEWALNSLVNASNFDEATEIDSCSRIPCCRTWDAAHRAFPSSGKPEGSLGLGVVVVPLSLAWRLSTFCASSPIGSTTWSLPGNNRAPRPRLPWGPLPSLSCERPLRRWRAPRFSLAAQLPLF